MNTRCDHPKVVQKNTVAINLASHLRRCQHCNHPHGYDPQGSSLHWLRSPRTRGSENSRRQRRAAEARPPRSFEMYVPPETRQLVIDTRPAPRAAPAGECSGRAHCVIIPVVPSSLDIPRHGELHQGLLSRAASRERNIRLAVVANRVRRSMPVYPPLERFSTQLNMKLLARLIDSDVYVHARKPGLEFSRWTPGVARRAQAVHAVIDWVDGRKAPRDDARGDALRAGAHPLRVDRTAWPGWKSTGAYSSSTTSTARPHRRREFLARAGALTVAGVRRWRWRRRSCRVTRRQTISFTDERMKSQYVITRRPAATPEHARILARPAARARPLRCW